MRRDIRVRQGARAVRQRLRRSRPEQLPSTAGDRTGDMAHGSPRRPAPRRPSTAVGVVHTSSRRVAPASAQQRGCGQDGMARSPSRVPRPAPHLRPEADHRGLENPRHQMSPLDPRFEPALPARRRPRRNSPSPLHVPSTDASSSPRIREERATTPGSRGKRASPGENREAGVSSPGIWRCRPGLDLRCATCVSHAAINSFSSEVADSWRAPPRSASSTMHRPAVPPLPSPRMRSRANAVPLTRETRQRH